MFLKLSIYSPERCLVHLIDISEVTLTAQSGQFQILPGHIPIVGLLDVGLFQYLPLGGGGGFVRGVISTGFFEVREFEVRVFAETLELDQEIDTKRARIAQEKAERTLSDASLDDKQFRKYEFKLQRAIIRQNLGKKK